MRNSSSIAAFATVLLCCMAGPASAATDPGFLVQRFDAAPAGAFYVWANLAKLPTPLDDGMNFFRECLKEKVIVVPGVFFDVNPGNRRATARYKNYCRISFGPEIEKLELGLNAFERLIAKFK